MPQSSFSYDRRSFLKTAGIVSLFSVAPPIFSKALARFFFQDEDELICRSKFQLATSQSLATRPIHEVMIAVGKSFLGTKYAAKTLEQPSEERLVINLRRFDCVTYCESILALSCIIKKNQLTFDDYKKELQTIRYRNGVIDQYPSRLHYFSDWIYDNNRREIVKDVTMELGGVRYKKKIHFMTSHANLYKQLGNKWILARMKATEEEISKREMYFLPERSFHRYAVKIQSGDIIGITTNIEGLDIIHTGLAIRLDNGNLHYLYAPNLGDKIKISKKTLHDYVASYPRQTGVMVARPLGPELRM